MSTPKDRWSPVTIAQIAKEAGVHPSTVSRSLGAARDARVSTATVERIREVAKELGYVTNPWAASLRTRKTKLIGVVVPELRDPIHATFCQAIEEIAHDRGYQAIFTSSGDTVQGERVRINGLLGRRVEGLILTDAHRKNSFLTAAADFPVPVVLALRTRPDFPAVAADDFAGGVQVAAHLWQQGHRKFIVIGGMTYASTAHQRIAGFTKKLTDLGVPDDDIHVIGSRFDVDSGYAVANDMLAKFPDVTAIFAVTDLLAIGAACALQERDLAIGADVAVIGYNNLPMTARMPIPISSVDISLPEVAERALDMLIGLLHGHQSSPITQFLQPKLIVRDSSRNSVAVISANGAAH